MGFFDLKITNLMNQSVNFLLKISKNMYLPCYVFALFSLNICCLLFFAIVCLSVRVFVCLFVCLFLFFVYSLFCLFTCFFVRSFVWVFLYPWIFLVLFVSVFVYFCLPASGDEADVITHYPLNHDARL